MSPWQNTLSIGADDVGLHSIVDRPIENDENTSGGRFLCDLSCVFQF